MNDRVDKMVSALSRSEQIILIPIDRLRVLNPRTRNPYFFSQLVENIASVGLKRPITVAHGGRDSDGDWHEVLCGQGRLEALKALGETMIPCSIVEANEIDRYLITLTENIARRRHSTVELLSGLQVLRAKGYTTVEIAKKTNLDDSYINGILQLLERGEQRLIQAVEKSAMPLWLAVEVARAPTEEVQAAMVAAYESKTLTGEQLLRVRRILSKREASGKKMHGRPAPREKPSPQKLLRTYKNEVRRQQMIVQNANLQEQRLLLITSALRRFLADEHFRTLLRAEGIKDIPEAVASRIPPELMP
ncbi:ParB family chromosome partitioning protein [Paraburkholderia sp. GV068]|uniref:ParB/RepB/Spo0J family partition protein n=1 Tax=unclassified Paraburkholderia TaxID=2615204 RepID=UPI000D3038B1|nr:MULTISPECIES: plasmid partitioning protein RepB C-terminal domain-containing protein [unclassified Paraburkholderia]PTR03806.1 ParB family chromosome partitioning protein [Paraburkholderia sp. GV072]PUB08764.1 ParB family chromosome partitioning protein [Paraburkholderia sp. GV068]